MSHRLMGIPSYALSCGRPEHRGTGISPDGESLGHAVAGALACGDVGLFGSPPPLGGGEYVEQERFMGRPPNFYWEWARKAISSWNAVSHTEAWWGLTS